MAQISYPGVIKMSHTTENEAIKELMRKDCHDIRNIATLISSTYQLINVKNPSLSEISRWSDLGTEIKELVDALVNLSNDINQI